MEDIWGGKMSLFIPFFFLSGQVVELGMMSGKVVSLKEIQIKENL